MLSDGRKLSWSIISRWRHCGQRDLMAFNRPANLWLRSRIFFSFLSLNFIYFWNCKNQSSTCTQLLSYLFVFLTKCQTKNFPETWLASLNDLHAIGHQFRVSSSLKRKLSAIMIRLIKSSVRWLAVNGSIHLREKCTELWTISFSFLLTSSGESDNLCRSIQIIFLPGRCVRWWIYYLLASGI